MLNNLKKSIPDTHPLRLLYHKMMAILAAVYYGFPARKMTVVAVTGTNGKTTTVNLIAKILEEAGYKVGMASTINFQVAEEKWVNTSKQSTQGPFQLQKLLKRMLTAGCKYVVLEVTSHAVTQSRIFGINIDVAVVTNVTEDHIEYHGSFNNYLSAKLDLFKAVSKAKRKFGVPKVLITNADDKYFSVFDEPVADRKMSYGLKRATLRADGLEKKPTGTDFVLHIPNNSIPVSLHLPGEFNVYNALAASSVALALQVPLEKVKSGLESSHSMPGRAEIVDCGQNYAIVVDYAHTPDGLENLLALYSSLTAGRLFVVFGLQGGGRDKAKRPVMGEIANKYADYIILTNDDPYEEDEYRIIDDVGEAIPRKEGADFWKMPSRREAIRLALTMAKEGDCVVMAGKGAEEIMMVKGGPVPWNDRKTVEELLRREIKVELDGGFEQRSNVCLES